MPLPPALTTTQKNVLRGEVYQANVYVAINPNTIVGTARINQTSFPSSITQLTFDTGSGMSNVKVGQTVLISKVNDVRQAYWRGRVRKAVSGSMLFINQTSANFSDDDYIFVIDDVGLHPKLPYADSRGNIFVDYDVPFRQLVPLVQGLQSAYVITLDNTPKADLALTPTGLATTHGATISSWSWDAPAATFVVGSTSTKDVTLRWVTAGVRWVRVTVTDDGGRSNFFTFPVFVCSADYSDPFIRTDVENLSISGDEGGYSGDVTFFDTLNVLDQTLVTVFSVENNAPVVSNINFVGRLNTNKIQTLADKNYTFIPTTSLSMLSITPQAGMCPITTWSMMNKSSPTTWGDVNKLTIWRGLVFIATELSTLSNITSIEFDSTANTYETYSLPVTVTVLLDALNALSDAINMRVWATPQGELHFQRSARFLPASERNALTTVMSFEAQDLQSYNLNIEPRLNLGKMFSYGGSYNTTTTQTDIYQAIAPAVALADGTETAEAINQVLAANANMTSAKSELGERVGNDFARRNPYPKIEAMLHDGFHFLQPNDWQWYTFIITASLNNRSVSYSSSNRWLCERVSLTYENNIGSWAVTAEFGLETKGGGYQTVTNIAPNQIDFALPPYPVDDAYPAFPDNNPFAPEQTPSPENTPPVSPKDKQPISNPVSQPNQSEILGGDVVAVWNSVGIWLTKNYTKSSMPVWKQVFATGATLTDFKFGAGNHAYAITNNGVNSTFWRTSNIFAGSPSWLATTIVGKYDLIRTTDTGGKVYIGYGTSCGESITFASASSLPSGMSFEERLSTSSSWIPYTWTPFTEPTPNTTNPDCGIRIIWDITCNGAVTVNWARLVGNTASINIETWDGSSWVTQYASTKPLGSPTSFTDTWSNTSSISFTKLRITLITRPKFTSVSVGGGDGTQVMLSTNHGETFPIINGAGVNPPSLGGMDTQRIGNLIFASPQDKIRQAVNAGVFSDTSGGGTTGTFARLIRTYGMSGVKLIFGTEVAMSGDTLWKIDGGVTAISPNDGSFNGLVVGDNCLDMWVTSNNDIIGVFSFGGTRKLARTTNGGGSWIVSATAINSGSRYLRVRQSDVKRKQVYLFNTDDCLYSDDSGATLQLRKPPAGSLIGIEVKS